MEQKIQKAEYNTYLEEPYKRDNQLETLRTLKEELTEKCVNLDDIVDVSIITETSVKDIRLKLVTDYSEESTEYKEVTLHSPLGQAIYEKKTLEPFSYNVKGKNMSGIIKKIKTKNYQKKALL